MRRACNIIGLIVLIQGLGPSGSGQAQPPKLRRHQGNNTARALGTNDFTVSRGFLDYGQRLTYVKARATADPSSSRFRNCQLSKGTYDDDIVPPERNLFMRYMKRLPGTAVWLDVGAGYAGAQREYRRDGGHAKLVALGLERPKAGTSIFCTGRQDEALTAFERGEGPRFRYLSGKSIEAYNPARLRARIGAVDVITDVFGALSYSPNMHRVIETYGKLLRPGGKMFLHYDHKALKIQRPGRGDPVSLESWLKTVPGLRVRRTYTLEQWGREPLRGLVVERTSSTLRVPALGAPAVNDRLLPPTMTFPQL